MTDLNEEKKYKILLVDDEPNIVKTLKARLEANKWQVVTATDGAAGLQAAYQERPDLIILDIMMPKMDGFEVCQRLRADVRFKTLPILMLTAKAQKIDQVWGLRIGATEYLVKPFESVELVKKINHYLSMSHKTETKEETAPGGSA
jgi:two-component system alkaline phosphatase synthesis response regulator PhoP